MSIKEPQEHFSTSLWQVINVNLGVLSRSLPRLSSSPPSLGLSWHTAPISSQSITHLLTGGFLFKTSATILLGGGSLFQPENRETSKLKRKRSAPSQGPNTFPEA